MDKIIEEIKFNLKKGKEYKDLVLNTDCDKECNKYNRIANEYLKVANDLLRQYPELEDKVKD